MAEDVDVFAKFGECAADGCGELCPWDMASIILNDKTVYCSPDCARGVFDQTELEKVTLHDPQNSSDRDAFGVDKDVVDIEREVSDIDDAKTALKYIENHTLPFRPQPAE